LFGKQTFFSKKKEKFERMLEFDAKVAANQVAAN
jgi:hypothetical protein